MLSGATVGEFGVRPEIFYGKNKVYLDVVHLANTIDDIHTTCTRAALTDRNPTMNKFKNKENRRSINNKMV